jgi:HAD superfamily hydrolase (TIGR01549 family)
VELGTLELKNRVKVISLLRIIPNGLEELYTYAIIFYVMAEQGEGGIITTMEREPALKKAFFFDFGDTLASTDPPYIYRIAMAMRRAGFKITDLEFEAEYAKADYRLFLKHADKGSISPQEHREWFFPILYESLSPSTDIDKFREKVRREMSEIGFTRAALPGAARLLDHIKGKGYTIAVISNNDGYTEEKCEEVGIRQYLDYIFDSTNLDMIKPDPRIFRYAADKLGISPGDAIHIGDMYGSDIMGALNAGVDVLWFNGRGVKKFNDTEVTEVGKLAEIIRLVD